MSASSPREGLFVRMLIDARHDEKWKAFRAEYGNGVAYAFAYVLWTAAIEVSMRAGLEAVAFPDIVEHSCLTRQTAQEALARLAKHELAIVESPGRPKPNIVTIPNIARHQIKLRNRSTPNAARGALNAAAPTLDDGKTSDRPPNAAAPTLESQSNAAVGAFNAAAAPFNASRAALTHPIEARGRDGEREERDSEYVDIDTKTANGSAVASAGSVCSFETELRSPAVRETTLTPAESSEPSEATTSASTPLESLVVAQDQASEPDLGDLPPGTAAAVSTPCAGLLKAPARKPDGRLEYLGLSMVFGRAFEASSKANGVPCRATHSIEAMELVATLPNLIAPGCTQATWDPATHGRLFSIGAFDAANTFCLDPWNKLSPFQRITWPAYLRKAFSLFAFEVSEEAQDLKNRIKTTKDDTLKNALLDTLKGKRYGTSPHGAPPQHGHPATPQSTRIEPLARGQYFQEGFK